MHGVIVTVDMFIPQKDAKCNKMMIFRVTKLQDSVRNAYILFYFFPKILNFFFLWVCILRQNEYIKDIYIKRKKGYTVYIFTQWCTVVMISD